MRVAAVQLNSSDEATATSRPPSGSCAPPRPTAPSWSRCRRSGTCSPAARSSVAGAEPLDGPSLTAARGWARELGIHLLAGSISERGPGGEKPFNTSVLIGPDGEDLAVYRKIHMFDVDVGGVTYRESEHEEPGEEIVTGARSAELIVGLTRLLRPALSRALPDPRPARRPRDHRPLGLHRSPPAATTGRCCCGPGRSRTRSSSLAPNQVGEAPPHYDSYGRSAIVDPWGVVLAAAPDEECFVAADLDLAAQERVRESLPSLANRRPGAYAWPQLTEARA